MLMPRLTAASNSCANKTNCSHSSTNGGYTKRRIIKNTLMWLINPTVDSRNSNRKMSHKFVLRCTMIFAFSSMLLMCSRSRLWELASGDFICLKVVRKFSSKFVHFQFENRNECLWVLLLHLQIYRNKKNHKNNVKLREQIALAWSTMLLSCKFKSLVP